MWTHAGTVCVHITALLGLFHMVFEGFIPYVGPFQLREPVAAALTTVKTDITLLTCQDYEMFEECLSVLPLFSDNFRDFRRKNF